MKTYLCGPMRGIPEFNFPAFHGAAADLRLRGHEVWSPAENDVEQDGFDPTKSAPATMKHYMARDLPAVLASDAVVVLPGWENSTGANLEVHVARKCDIPVLRYPDLEPVRFGDPRYDAILDEMRHLHRKKSADYGLGADLFANVRASQELGIPAWKGAFLRANDKVTRIKAFCQNGSLANESLEDSLMDNAAYNLIALLLFREEKNGAAKI